MNPPRIKEYSLRLEPWQEVIANCIDVKITQNEAKIILKLMNQKVTLFVELNQSNLEKIKSLKGKRIGVLRTDECYELREI